MPSGPARLQTSILVLVVRGSGYFELRRRAKPRPSRLRPNSASEPGSGTLAVSVANWLTEGPVGWFDSAAFSLPEGVTTKTGAEAAITAAALLPLTLVPLVDAGTEGLLISSVTTAAVLHCEL